MSGTDLLKVLMLIGIVFAVCGIRWIDKEIAELDEELRRLRARKDCGEETS